MRKMLPSNKAKLLDKQVIHYGVIIDENNREFNGDVNFTGNVSGAGLKLYKHHVEISNGTSFSFLSDSQDKICGDNFDYSTYEKLIIPLEYQSSGPKMKLFAFDGYQLSYINGLHVDSSNPFYYGGPNELTFTESVSDY